MPKLSVIVPVYNTEKYVEKCLNSLKNQTMKDIEILIVNDGSTGNSEEIIKRWIESNKEINAKYYKKENGGLSDTRNYGVSNSTGKYIMFLDSDDYINENLFENLSKYMDKNVDVIKFKMVTLDEEENEIQKLSGPVFDVCSGEEAFKKLAGNDNFLEVACIYLYRREFFISNKFEYNTVNKFHEDFGLTPLVIVNAKTLVSTDIYGYYYLQTSNSIMRNEDYNKTIIKSKDVLAHYDNMIEKVESYKISKETKDLLKRYYTNSVIIKAKELRSKERKEYFKQIRKRKMYKNIKPINLKQAIKRVVLFISLNLYLKMR